MSLTPEEYQERKLAGICVRQGCTADQREDNLLCAHHATMQVEYKRRWYGRPRGKRLVNRQRRRWRAAMKAQARCGCCGRGELVTETYCETCRRDRMARDRAKPGRVHGQRKCSVCAERGHDRRTCERRASVDALPIEHYAAARQPWL